MREIIPQEIAERTRKGTRRCVVRGTTGYGNGATDGSRTPERCSLARSYRSPVIEARANSRTAVG